MSKSKEAFYVWKKTSFSDRSFLLNNVADILQRNKNEYAKLITKEMGKPIFLSEIEIERCIWVCKYYSENAEKFLKDEYVKTDADKSYVCFTPLGVILSIMPWNFPFWQVFRFAAPCIIAGNIILLKHSSNVTQCSLAIEKIFNKAGFPTDTFKSMIASSKSVSNIIQSDGISGIAVTASNSTGKNVAEKAGSKLKKLVLELGGNDPFIVLKDADITNTVKQAVISRMLNGGQSCAAAKRFIVVEDIFDEFIDGFLKMTNRFVMGDPMDKKTRIGPLARQDILDKIDDQVKKSVKKGANIITGGKKLEDTPGFYYLPTVLTNIKEDMPVYCEETFGPVAPIIKVKNEKEAISVANDTVFGLGASIWTQDISRGESLIKDVQAGALFVNDIAKSDPRLPFGGIKQSGYGRELSDYGIKEFANIQSVYIKKITKS